MTRSTRPGTAPDASEAPPPPAPATSSVMRIRSADLFRHMREIEIEHGGRIYRLRLTQLNKLILTA